MSKLRAWPQTLVVLSLGIWLTLSGCHHATRGEAALSPAQTERTAVFDSVVSTVGTHTAPLADPEINWQLIVESYRPRAMAAADTEAFYAIVDAMLRELGISHTLVVAPRRAEARVKQLADAPVAPLTPQVDAQAAAPKGPARGHAGLDFRWVDDRLVVRSVTQGGPAALAGVTAGMTVLRVDELKVEEAWSHAYLASIRKAEAELHVRQTFLLACQGPAGSPMRLEALALDGERKSFEFERELNTSKVMSFGHLTVEGELEVKELEGGVGYVRWNVFMLDLMPELEKSIRGFKEAPGLILDLRGNPGGVAMMSQGVAGMLTDKLTNLGVMQSEAMELRFPVFPKYGAYLGPVVVLVDGTSASTSEILAAGLQEIGRAVVVGEVSAGMVLPSLFIELPDGGMLQYATALYRTPKGRVLEGVGVTPNVTIGADPAAWSTGADPAVEQARRMVLGYPTTPMSPP